MSEIKWIKIVVDMFEDSKIEFIRSLPEGDSIIVTWIQMMSIAGKSNMGGYLMVTDDIPYSEQFLSTKLKRSPVFVQFALETLMKLKMINIEDGPYHITNWEKHQNVDGMEKVKLQNKERKRKQREREKLLLLEENNLVSRDCHVTVTEEVTACHATDIDLELEKELKDKNISGTKVPERKKFIQPTIEQVKEYCFERGNRVDAENWFDYYTSNGWKVGKNQMKDWKAAVRTWERNDTSKKKQTSSVITKKVTVMDDDPYLEEAYAQRGMGKPNT